MPTNNYELRTLLANLRKTVELCFFTEVQQHKQQQNILESENGKQFLIACLEVLQHKLIINSFADIAISSPASTTNNNNNNNTNKNNYLDDKVGVEEEQEEEVEEDEEGETFKKFIEDFEYLYETTQLTQNSKRFSLEKTRLNKFLFETNCRSVKNFLLFWLNENLKIKCLTLCLQALIADNELKDLYYQKGAFLQSEDYATAFCICVSSLEQNQYNLLSQISGDLYQQSLLLTTTNNYIIEKTDLKPKRTGSHPNISFGFHQGQFRIENRKRYLTLSTDSEYLLKARKTARQKCSAIRKTKSLPNILSLHHGPYDLQEPRPEESQRPRCKTLDGRHYRRSLTFSKPKPIPKRLTNVEINIQNETSSSNTSFSPSRDELDCRPSTSKQRPLNHLSSTPNTRTLSNASSSISSSAYSNSISMGKQIEIINCDNIKIWTDQGLDEAASNLSSTNSVTIDFHSQSLNLAKPGKSLTPINNFFSNLFGTPTTYTSWSPHQYQDCNEQEVMDACQAFPCNKFQPNTSPITSSVFDAFLPTVGRKLRTRKPQVLFEDGISTLDCSSTAMGFNNVPKVAVTSSAITIEEPANTVPPISSARNAQTLTDYLKMSHLTRNSTDLEKENAHFTISEAIISAIEHIKWAKKDSETYNKNETPATKATDWLEKDIAPIPKDQQEDKTKDKHITIDDSDLLEHTPYAESGCYDELSAEIIGLSIISKFNDKHLPKVSELKWLVSDEDTPQSLLPMPDNSPSSNPDENVTTSMTRGTRYWAPPRQQIIFTDHPIPDRKALLLKQNFRCAGCGMRVAQQNIKSFRYCTYLGKYHCTGCHRNQMSATPAKILQSWDFKCYPVSVFAYRLLEQMYNFPLFYVPDLSPALYVQAKYLWNSRQKRRQLSFVKLFIRTCRFAVREQHYFSQIPEYITEDPDLWSLSDFMDVYDKSMERSIDDLVLKCENHIHNCVLCTARGFYCEHCNKEQIIFPWEKKTFRCDQCGSCYHVNCWHSMSEACSKCQRINKRQEQDIL